MWRSCCDVFQCCVVVMSRERLWLAFRWYFADVLHDDAKSKMSVLLTGVFAIISVLRCICNEGTRQDWSGIGWPKSLYLVAVVKCIDNDITLWSLSCVYVTDQLNQCLQALNCIPLASVRLSFQTIYVYLLVLDWVMKTTDDNVDDYNEQSVSK